MKNNNGKGLYDIGEKSYLPCGCVGIAEEVGYSHYVHPDCEMDNRYHPFLKGYQYFPLEKLPRGHQAEIIT
uniref:Uncharacterized protein n=1 Tax=viral metagenome TaxID=1070528 RepID=A0A6M3JVK3_9ZZZZ